MLHAAAMLAGLCIILLLATQAWTPQDLAIAIALSAACVLIAARFGGVGRGFSMAPRLTLLSFARMRAVLEGAINTLRAAAAADVTLKPALVRIKTRLGSPSARAAFANQISATPGMAVVDADSDGFLAHVLDEDAIDASELGALEQRAAGGAGS